MIQKRGKLLFAFIMLFILNSEGAFAQVRVIGEGNGAVVKLGWLPENWAPEMSGVMIQKKSGDGDWVLLTSSEIYPAIGLNKSLDNVEPSPEERTRLEQKLIDLEASGSLKPLDQEQYKEKVLSDPANLPRLAFAFSTDYDFMLLSGFAFIDRDIPAGENLEYGVFAVVNGQMASAPMGTFKWTSGKKLVSTLKMKTDMDVVGKKSKLLLRWSYSKADFKRNKLKGFNIYQNLGEQREKINTNVIRVSASKDPLTLSRTVKYPEAATKVVYEAVPVSQLDTELNGELMVFDPELYGQVLAAPILIYELKEDGVYLTYTLAQPASFTQLELQRRTLDGPYEPLSPLAPDEMSYTDRAANPNTDYLYRVIALPKIGGPQLWSNEVMVKLVDNEQPAVPENLEAEILQKEGSNYVRLTWDYPGDKQNANFRIFIESPFGEDLAHDASVPEIENTFYEYEVRGGTSKAIHFAVQAMNQERIKSPLSNRVKVITPTKFLPPLKIWPMEKSDNDVVLFWEYPENINDLVGFRVYKDQELIADERELGALTRKFKVYDLNPGDYRFSIEAVTQYGLLKKSATVKMNI